MWLKSSKYKERDRECYISFSNLTCTPPVRTWQMATPKTEDKEKALWILSSLAWKDCRKKQTALPLNHTITHNKLSNSCQSYGSLLSLILRIYFKIGHYLFKVPIFTKHYTLSFCGPFWGPQTKQFERVLAFKELTIEHGKQNRKPESEPDMIFLICSQVFIHVLYVFTNFPKMSLIPGEKKDSEVISCERSFIQ